MTNPSGSPPIILIVEDVDWIRLGKKQAVERCGYLVDEAKNNLEALTLAKHHVPDVILTEDTSPGFDALVASIRKHPTLCEVPIVVINPDAEAGVRANGAVVINDYDQIATCLIDRHV